MNEIKPTSSIGIPKPLVDGPEKVTGKARYSADFIPSDCLVGRIFRSPVSHAEIMEVDISDALSLPGVKAVITGEETDEPYGVLPIARFEYPMARDKVRYKGEPVACVAAVDVETAQKAIDLIKFKYKELPAYYTSQDAMAEGAVNLHDHRPGNVERDVDFDLGDTDNGLTEADLIMEEKYNCAEIAQVQSEPHAAIAEYDSTREFLTVHASTQVPYYGHKMLAKVLKMKESQIRMIKPFVGGGFGCRTECLNIELICALVARAAKGTVRIVASREETFITHRGRPETDVEMKIGVKNDGTITAVDFKAIQRGGAYSGYGVVTILYSGGLMFGLYDLPAVRYRGLRILTNTPPPGAMRGHGITDVRYAFENLLDKVANKLGVDPIEIRRKNLLEGPKYETLNEMFINSYGLPECLDWVEEKSGWKSRKGNLGPNRGLGIACAHYPSGASKPVNWTGEPHATIHLKLDWDASITVLTGAPEIGQGSTTMATQCAAEVLGLDMSRFQSLTSDSKLTPKDNGSYSSRVTYMVGNASIDAAKNLKNILIEAAARKLEVKPEDIECLGEVYRAGSQDEGLSFPEVVQAALEGTGTITVKGNFDTLPESWGTKKYRGGAISGSMAYAYAAQVVEVSVDPDTAEITVEKVWAAQDVGKALNPLAVEGQIEGSVWMGMGQAISEGTKYVNGLGITNNMLDYRVPTIIESPPIDVGIIESVDPHGPFGAKEAGETSLVAFIPALTNAIADAVGVRPLDLPVTSDHLLELMENYKTREAAE
ncbi:MAG: 4-hydroxybenzoyl-CoA reductase subunit alpha [Rhodospirillaceae bacterium]|nr:4-hydroxybenzoyl-CoA reductase subunit alpha [Rhodospirillaceae bacterium]OUT76524.1 MAG: 4-hydroxybenzoyl-CoA reductase subunit alpha [Rhodospirillaceae bacterium TMED23]|tara:strand:+ start:2428 stop:4740 length:2313 start_codon:yes stop_codon:yes gene_type:complete